MKISVHTPEPVEPPPPTYDLTDLSRQEMDDIRHALFHRACHEKDVADRDRFRLLHHAVYRGQNGYQYVRPEDFDRTYTPWGVS